jgi:GNAT superfamily N-acetyltransferase
MIEIVPCESRHYSDLTKLANSHLRLVPPSDGSITVKGLEQIIIFYERLWVHHYPDITDARMKTKTWVALDDGNAIGVIMARPEVLDLEESSEESGTCGEIPLLLFSLSKPDCGVRLLEHSIEYLRSERCDSVVTSGRNPLGLGWSGVPVTWKHSMLAYKQAGFVESDQWIILTGRTDHMSTDPAPLPPSLTVIFTPFDERREWRLEVYHNEKFAAECDARGVPPHLDDAWSFRDWVIVEWIGVDTDFRGQGLGYWIMMKQLLHHLRSGRKNVLLWTGPGNQIARSFYERLGFNNGPETRAFRRSI